MTSEPLLSAPLILNWALTNRCNFNCKHCYSREEEMVELDTDTICLLIRKAAKAGILSVNFGGGEPMLRSGLLDIICLASQLGLAVSMNSNGALIDHQTARDLKNTGIRKVGISIDSSKAAIHNKFRGAPGSHDQATQALHHLNGQGIETSVSSVICRINVDDLHSLVEMAISASASSINFHDFKCSGLGYVNKDELDLKPNEWRTFYKQALALRASTTKIKIMMEDPVIATLGECNGESMVKGSVCGKLSLCIKPNGDITPCGFIPTVVGNLLDDSIEELWHKSPVLKAMRNKQARGKCVNCSHHVDCLGGCSARALALTGDINNPDPHCWYDELL